jgi:hypothetical protein
MIALDSSHPFDWPGFAQSIEREANGLLSELSGSGVFAGSRRLDELEAEVGKFGRQLPQSARIVMERDFRPLGQRYGIAFVDVNEALALRRSFQGVDGLAKLLGEAFLPIFYIGEGATASVYLPKQTEACADSFVVLVDQVPAGFEFGAFSLGAFLLKLGATVHCGRHGYPERLGQSVPPLLREWLL